MADDEDQSPDERSDQTPTADELQAAELAKTRQALLVAAAMQQSESQLPNRLPTQAAPVAPPVPPPMTGTQPPPPGTPGYEFGRGIGVLRPPTMAPIAPLAPTTPIPTGLFPGQVMDRSNSGQGRMYMGPNMTLEQERAFMNSPQGTSIHPPRPEVVQPQTRLQQMQDQDQPGSRTIAINDEPPYSDASLANQRNAMLYNAMKKFDAGDRSPDNMALLLGKTASAGKRYNVAGVGLVDENGRVITAHPNSTQTRTVQGVGLVDAKTGRVITPSVQKPETQTETETFPANPGSPGSPAQDASSGFLGIGAHPDLPAVPEVPAHGERKITRKVPVKAPASQTQSVQPMPKEKSQLVSGRVYQTSRGPARWDGGAFVIE